MYQSLYRKYRPQYLEEIVGQQVIVRILTNEIINNKISHAYLFSGPRGTGKTSIAKILAKTVNCSNLIDAKPCNICVECTQTNDGQSVDIIEIDAASNNGVDEIRELRSKVSLVPSVGKYKIYIIDEVHMLTTGAFNALLKTLEEPPKHVIFILATTELHKIPTTILSRCQKFDFKRISIDNIVSRLTFISNQEKFKIDKYSLFEIARLSNGGLRDAIGMLEQVTSYTNDKIDVNDVHNVNGTLPQEQIKKLINLTLKNDIKEMLIEINEYDNKGSNLQKLVEEIILFLKNVIIYQKNPDFFNDNISREIYSDISNQIKTKDIIKIITKINNLSIDLKYYNNPRLVLEIIMISIIDKDIKIIEEGISKKSCNNNRHTQSESNFKEHNIPVKENNNKQAKQEQIKPIPTEEKKINKLLKDTRVNNTFVNAERQILNNIKISMEKVRNYLLTPEYSQIASLLIDGEVRAAGKTNLVIVYQTQSLSNSLNEQLKQAEKFLVKVLGKKYKIVSTSESEWSVYRKEYKHNKLQNNKYDYIEETEELQKYIEKQNKKINSKTEIDMMFGSIIEYVK